MKVQLQMCAQPTLTHVAKQFPFEVTMPRDTPPHIVISELDRYAKPHIVRTITTNIAGVFRVNLVNARGDEVFVGRLNVRDCYFWKEYTGP